MYLHIFNWYKLQCMQYACKTDKELYVWKGRRKNGRDEASNLGSSGRISTSREGETFRFGHFLHSWGRGRDHMRRRIQSWGGGGVGRLRGLPSGGGKAGDTFSSEKTGFSLSMETLSSLEPFWSMKYLSFLSTTLYGPQYSWERGEEEAYSWTNTTQSLTKVEVFFWNKTSVVPNRFRETGDGEVNLTEKITSGSPI